MLSNADTSRVNVGWIGTGIMGAAMCKRIMDRGYNTYVHNRSKHKAEELIKNGATWCHSPSEVVNSSDVVFTMVGFPSDVREVYFGKEGIFKALGPGKFLVDMTTTEPSLAVEIYNKAKELGSYSVDAPVSGGDVGAQSGRLSIMVGGDEKAVDCVMSILSLLGHQIVYEGRAGMGQHAKMCNQITVAGIMIGICEALLYCYKSGLSQEKMIKTVCAGAASNWLMENLGPRIVKGDYSPGFFVEHFIKDLGIAIREAERFNISLPGLELAKQLYEKAKQIGHGRSGTQALYLALSELS